MRRWPPLYLLALGLSLILLRDGGRTGFSFLEDFFDLDVLFLLVCPIERDRYPLRRLKLMLLSYEPCLFDEVLRFEFLELYLSK
ncbi:MAG: hypothetical protein AAFY15_11880 [Cyanobacteria bacterium J06648_11]